MKKTRIKAEDLIPIKDAHTLFGEGWSKWSVARRIERQELKEGKHYIDDSPPSSSRRRIKLIISAIEEWRGELSYKR